MMNRAVSAIRSDSFLDSVIFWSVSAAAFLVPIAWNPFGMIQTELAGQALLAAAAFAGAAAWLGRLAIRGSARITAGPVVLAGGAFLAALSFASFFSLDWRASVFGSHGWYSDSVLSIGSALFLGLLFGWEIAPHPRKAARVAGSFALALSLASCAGLIAFFGGMQAGTLPVPFSQLFAMALGGGALLSGFAAARGDRLTWGACWGVMLAAVAGLAAVSIPAAWIPGLAGLLASCALLLWMNWRRSSRAASWNLAGLILLLALLAIFAASSPLFMDAGRSWVAAGRALMHDAGSFLAGMGPGTLLQALFSFERFLPDSAAFLPYASPYWGSFLASLAAGAGMLGIVAFAALVIAAGSSLASGVSLRGKARAGMLLEAPAGQAMLACVVLVFFLSLAAGGMPSAASLLALSIAFGTAASLRPGREIVLRPGQSRIRWVRASALAAVLGGALLSWNLGEAAVAEASYARALRMQQQSDGRIPLLEASVRFDPARPEYRLALAEAYISRGLRNVRERPPPGRGAGADFIRSPPCCRVCRGERAGRASRDGGRRACAGAGKSMEARGRSVRTPAGGAGSA